MTIGLVTGGRWHQQAFLLLKKYKTKVLLFDDNKNNYLTKKYKIACIKLNKIGSKKFKNIFYWSPCNDIGSALSDYYNLNTRHIRSKISFENGQFDKSKTLDKKTFSKINRKKKYLIKSKLGSGSRNIRIWNYKKFNEKKFFIQEFFQGIELSVEVCSFKGKHEIISVSPRILENYKSAIGIFSLGNYIELKKLIQNAVYRHFKKLRIVNGISHNEIILLKRKKIKFIDVNLRCGGAGVADFYIPKISKINPFLIDYLILFKKLNNFKLKKQGFGFILYNSSASSHFKKNLLNFKKIGIYEKIKRNEKNNYKKDTEVDSNRTEILCAKFRNKTDLFKTLSDILRPETFDKLRKIDKELSLLFS